MGQYSKKLLKSLLFGIRIWSSPRSVFKSRLNLTKFGSNHVQDTIGRYLVPKKTIKECLNRQPPCPNFYKSTECAEMWVKWPVNVTEWVKP